MLLLSPTLIGCLCVSLFLALRCRCLVGNKTTSSRWLGAHGLLFQGPLDGAPHLLETVEVVVPPRNCGILSSPEGETGKDNRTLSICAVAGAAAAFEATEIEIPAVKSHRRMRNQSIRVLLVVACRYNNVQMYIVVDRLLL